MTKRDVDRQVLEVDVLCDLASVTIRSDMPIGLGDDFVLEHDDLLRMLEEVPRRFKQAMERAQREHGWPAR